MDLKKFFQNNKKVALAFSGGVDSVFLMFAAKHFGADIKAYFVDSAFQTNEDREDARKAARLCSCDIEFIFVDILLDDRISSNSSQRCYYCKHRIFSTIIEKAREDGYNLVIDGSNASDIFDERPGMKALMELGVRSPLRECKMTKEDIRKASREMGIFTWNKPSNSCLATRVVQNQKITDEKLKIIEYAERELAALGLEQFRLRLCDDYCILQVKEEDFSLAVNIRNEAASVVGKCGISKIYLDLKGR